MRLLRRISRRLMALLMLLSASAGSVLAQNDAQFSQYYEVKNYYNPAAIGTGDLLNVRVGGKIQWLGIENAPQTFIALGEMPLKLFNKRFGVGLLVQQESLGLYKNLTVGAQAGYKTKLLRGELTVAIQAGFINQAFKGTDIYIPDEDDYHQSGDNALPNTDIAGNALDIGLGVYYIRKNWWAGLSVTHVNQPTVSLKNDAGDTNQSNNFEFEIGRTFYLMFGCNIPVKNTLFEVMPSMIIKSDMTFTTGEISGRLRYNKFLTGGLGYRWDDAVIITLGAEYKGFWIGYSYDYPVSAISKGSSGSHEVFAGYSLKLDFSEKNKNKHKSIRIM